MAALSAPATVDEVVILDEDMDDPGQEPVRAIAAQERAQRPRSGPGTGASAHFIGRCIRCRPRRR